MGLSWLVNRYKFHGHTISENHSWLSYITIPVQIAKKRLYFPRKHRKAKFQSQILVNFDSRALESILTGKINWYGLCTAQDRKALQWVIKTTLEHHWYHLRSINDIIQVRCLHRTQRVRHKDITQTATVCSPSRTIHCCTARLGRSYIFQAVRLRD